MGARLSGGAFEDDRVAEGFELADVLAAKAVGVDAPGVEVRAEVGVAGVGVGEQVPDDDQDGAADGDVGFPGAAAAGDAPRAPRKLSVLAAAADLKPCLVTVATNGSVTLLPSFRGG